MELPILKTTITYMEMAKKPKVEQEVIKGCKIEKQNNPEVSDYMGLYKEIGKNYLWNYRPSQSEEEIKNIVQSDNTQIYYLLNNNEAIGIAEISVDDNNFEIVHFGLIPDFIDKVIGKQFFNNILSILWQQSPKRVWLSTCGLDHPKAIKFYQNAGFEIFKTKEGEFKDFRYNGVYKMTDAPQIPLAGEEHA